MAPRVRMNADSCAIYCAYCAFMTSSISRRRCRFSSALMSPPSTLSSPPMIRYWTPISRAEISRACRRISLGFKRQSRSLAYYFAGISARLRKGAAALRRTLPESMLLALLSQEYRSHHRRTVAQECISGGRHCRPVG